MSEQPVKWIASRGRVMRPGVHGQLPGADHEFAVMGGDDRAEALAETINAGLADLKRQLAEAQARDDHHNNLATSYFTQLQDALARAEAAEHRLEKAEFGRRECATRLTAAEARLETAVKALEEMQKTARKAQAGSTMPEMRAYDSGYLGAIRRALAALAGTHPGEQDGGV